MQTGKRPRPKIDVSEQQRYCPCMTAEGRRLCERCAHPACRGMLVETRGRVIACAQRRSRAATTLTARDWPTALYMNVLASVRQQSFEHPRRF